MVLLRVEPCVLLPNKKILGLSIVDINTVNGIRLTLEDGTWGLVRASSNSPNLVVVVESPTAEDVKNAMFHEIEARLSKYPEIEQQKVWHRLDGRLLKYVWPKHFAKNDIKNNQPYKNCIVNPAYKAKNQ